MHSGSKRGVADAVFPCLVDEPPSPSFSVVCCSISVGNYRWARCTVTIHYKIIPAPDTLYLYSSDPPLHTVRIPSILTVPGCSSMIKWYPNNLSGSQVCRIYPRSVVQVTGAVQSIILTSGTCWVIPPITQHQHWGEEWTLWLVSSVRRHCVVLPRS